MPIDNLLKYVKNTGMDKERRDNLGVAEGYHIAKCALGIGLLTGSVTFADDANKARLMMKNIDSELYDIIGSREAL